MSAAPCQLAMHANSLFAYKQSILLLKRESTLYFRRSGRWPSSHSTQPIKERTVLLRREQIDAVVLQRLVAKGVVETSLSIQGGSDMNASLGLGVLGSLGPDPGGNPAVADSVPDDELDAESSSLSSGVSSDILSG